MVEYEKMSEYKNVSEYEKWCVGIRSEASFSLPMLKARVLFDGMLQMANSTCGQLNHAHASWIFEFVCQ